MGGSRKLHNEGVSKPARVGGPPVQGLYDQPKSPARTSTPLYHGRMPSTMYIISMYLIEEEW